MTCCMLFITDCYSSEEILGWEHYQGVYSQDGQVTRTSCSTSSEDIWKVRLVVLFKFTRDFRLKGSDVGYGLTNQ